MQVSFVFVNFNRFLSFGFVELINVSDTGVEGEAFQGIQRSAEREISWSWYSTGLWWFQHIQMDSSYKGGLRFSVLIHRAYVRDLRKCWFGQVAWFCWSVQGPSETPYEGGVFQLAFSVPEQYPLQPPQVRFLTKIFHPNVHFKVANVVLVRFNGLFSFISAWDLFMHDHWMEGRVKCVMVLYS